MGHPHEIKKIKPATGSKTSVAAGESYDGVRYDRLPKYEQSKRDSSILKAMGPLSALALPGFAIAKASAAFANRKDIIYRQGKTPTKRGTGK